MKRSELLIRVMLLPLDYISIVVSFLSAYQLRGSVDEKFLLPYNEFFVVTVILSGLWIICLSLLGVYNLTKQRNKWNEVFAIILGSLAAITVSGSVIFFFKQIDFSRLVLVATTIIAITILISLRIFRNIVMTILYRKGIAIKKTLIVGTDQGAIDLVMSGITAEKDKGVEVIGVTTIEAFEHSFLEKLPDVVIQCDPNLSNEETARIVNMCEEHNCIFKFIPNIFEISAAKIISEDVAGVPVITLTLHAVDGWYAVMKRLLDVVGSIVGLVFLSPVFMAVAVAIKLDSPGTVLYRHKRVGKGGSEFELLKFRSMKMLEVDGKMLHADANKEVEKIKDAQKNYKLENDPRITRVGSFIRKTSLDELPQLINVLIGDISLVGPRAYLKKELDTQLERYPEANELVRRLVTVRPGITGVWQVSGRSNVDFSERVAMDAYYATQANLFLDIQILLKTIPVVLKGTGAM